jgi:ATP-dependent DNA helicase RecG
MSIPLNLFPGYESANLAFKQAYSPSLLKTVSAFANQHDGVILLGVDDQGQVTGVDQSAMLRLTIENAINDNIAPRPFYEISTRQLEGKTILVLKIQKGEYTPYYYGQKAYIRSDTASVAADRLTLNRLILAGQNTNFEDLPADDQHLTFSVLKEQFRTSKGVHALSIDLQKTLNLVRNDRKTNSAALFSDQNPVPGASLALLSFANQWLDLTDRLILERKSLLIQFAASLDFFQKHLCVAERIEGAYRQTSEEVPLAAYREAVVNALIHRDYQMPSQIKIEIHPDRIVLISPGGLPPGITEAEYMDGRHSIFRNPTIADIFMRLGLAEKMTTGIRRIKQYYFGRSKQPEFIFSTNALTVVLPREKADGSAGTGIFRETAGTAGWLLKDSAAVGYELSDPPVAAIAGQVMHHTTQAGLLVRRLRSTGAISRNEAEAMLGLGKTQTYKILRQMEVNGQIYRSGEGRSTRYHLLER